MIVLLKVIDSQILYHFYSLFKQKTLSLKSIGYNKRKFRVGDHYIHPHEFAILDPVGYFLRFSE